MSIFDLLLLSPKQLADLKIETLVALMLLSAERISPYHGPAFSFPLDALGVSVKIEVLALQRPNYRDP